MDIFNVLNLIGGLCLFLFGMNLMGQALERRAGGKLRSLLGKMTGRKLAGFATGLGITAVIQSSSATAGDQRHHGRQRRHDGHSMAAQPRRNPERRRVGAAAEAVVVHASFGPDRHCSVHVLQERQEKRHRRKSGNASPDS